MNNTKMLGFAIIALGILNVSVLGFLFFSVNKQDEKGRKMPREIIIQQLHFDAIQIAAYDKLIKTHKETIRNLDDSIKAAKNDLYQLLNTENIDSSKKVELFLKLAHYQKQIEATHFNHFLEIKSICKQEQLADYKELTEDLSKLFSHPRKPRNE